MKNRTVTIGTTPETLHVEAPGVTVNIQSGLSDREGRQVTRVDVSPEDESRGGDLHARVWRRDGARIVQTLPGEGTEAINRQAIAGATHELLALLDEVVPNSTIHWAVEQARIALKRLEFHAPQLHLAIRLTQSPALIDLREADLPTQDNDQQL